MKRFVSSPITSLEPQVGDKNRKDFLNLNNCPAGTTSSKRSIYGNSDFTWISSFTYEWNLNFGCLSTRSRRERFKFYCLNNFPCINDDDLHLTVTVWDETSSLKSFDCFELFSRSSWYWWRCNCSQFWLNLHKSIVASYFKLQRFRWRASLTYLQVWINLHKPRCVSMALATCSSCLQFLFTCSHAVVTSWCESWVRVSHMTWRRRVRSNSNHFSS